MSDPFASTLKIGDIVKFSIRWLNEAQKNVDMLVKLGEIETQSIEATKGTKRFKVLRIYADHVSPASVTIRELDEFGAYVANVLWMFESDLEKGEDCK